jgi:Tol biopolymer transport system component
MEEEDCMCARLLLAVLIVSGYGGAAFAANLVLPTGGRVSIQFISSSTDSINTLSVAAPAVSITASSCTPGAAPGLPGVPLINAKSSSPGCRVDLDADPPTPGSEPFAAGTAFEFRLCVQDTAGPCRVVWSSNQALNSDGFDHVIVLPSADSPERVFRIAWEESAAGGDSDFNDFIAVVTIIPTELACTATQITNNPVGLRPDNGIAPSISSDGTRIAFQHRIDPSNTDEISLFDTTTGRFRLITAQGFPQQQGLSFSPSINAAGSRIAYWSNADPTGNNPDHEDQIFLLDVFPTRLTQITLGGLSSFPSISADGTRIAFLSGADLARVGNPNHARRIFLFDTTTSRFTQITNASFEPFGSQLTLAPTISGNGTRIVFRSEEDLTGDNPDQEQQVFMFEIATGRLTQITSGGLVSSGFNDSPSINFDGTRIAFASHADFAGGSNPNNALQIFLFDTTTGRFTQISKNIGGFIPVAPGVVTALEARAPSISSNGTRIAFASNDDLVKGGNPDHDFQIFLFDTNTGTLTQVTSRARVNFFPSSINEDGTRIAFAIRPTVGSDQIGLALCSGIIVNDLVSQSLPSVTQSFSPAPVQGGPSGTLTITAAFVGKPFFSISRPFFEVVELSSLFPVGGNVLLNADGAPGGIGARLTPDVGADGVLAAGEILRVSFVIGLQSLERFTFRVNLLGVPAP